MAVKTNAITEDEKRVAYLFDEGLSDEKKYQKLLDAAWSLNNKGYSDYMAWENGIGNKRDIWAKNRKNKDVIKRLLEYYGSYLDFYDGDRDENDLPNGRGTIKYHDSGEKYEGAFVHGRRTGYGESFDAFGKKIYEGMWQDDLYEGKGILYSGKGCVIEGNWVKGELEGKFTAMLSDGGTLSGTADGKGNLSGAEVCFFNNGDSFVCTFVYKENGIIPCGKGVYTFFDGTVMKGVWNENGEREGKFVLKRSNGILMEYSYRSGKLISRKRIRQ